MMGVCFLLNLMMSLSDPCVFRALAQVSSIFGSKVMLKIFKKLQEAPRGLTWISLINILPFLP